MNFTSFSIILVSDTQNVSSVGTVGPYILPNIVPKIIYCFPKRTSVLPSPADIFFLQHPINKNEIIGTGFPAYIPPIMIDSC